MDPRDQTYLKHILSAAQAIQRSAGHGRETFMADQDAYDAALRRLQTIAESMKRLSPALKMRHPEIPWTRIAGFKNRIVHAYMDVDPHLIWSVIDQEVPGLIRLATTELAAD